MPRKINPGGIKVGPGKQVPEGGGVTLGGAGMVGAGPNIGDAQGPPPFGPGDGGSSAALKAHIESAKAHPANAIYTTGGPSTLSSSNVDGEIDELAGGMPPEPPNFGYVHPHMDFNGIPDWNLAKLLDAPLFETISSIATVNDSADIFPYYYTSPTPTQDAEFPARGTDPQTDFDFNSGLSGPGNLGGASSGAYTRPPSGPGPSPVVRSTSILHRSTSPNSIIVSGTVYPADRGVLAFFHWPAGGDLSDFLSQPLLDRVKCAILLGQGILGKGPCSNGSCDGGTGGIFSPGENALGDYDPFAYPGLSTGQYDLHEISTGFSDIDSSPLRPPWDDKDGDGSPGWKRMVSSVLPGPGQVRLGTDPNAGVAVEPYGIPILGGDIDTYDAATPPPDPYGDVLLSPSQAWYFRYRLPYLRDYTQATGLKWTPGGVPGTETSTKEKARYFGVPPVGVAPGVTELNQAGNYADFEGDQYSWQIARFRFGFNLKYTGGAADYEEHGTYFFMHFKREVDFEAFVRDGVMPDDPTDGYEIYSALPSFLPDPSIEAYGNRVNEETDPNAFAPAGPAPSYGYKAFPYHLMRVNIFEDPEAFQVAPGDIVSSDMVFTATGQMTVSGVPYWIPKDTISGLHTAQVQVDTQVDNFWRFSYRTDDRPLSGSLGNTPPALLSTPNPAFIGVAPFAYEDASFSVPTGAAGSFYTPSDYYLRLHRLEIPYTHLGGTGSFSETDGPVITDSLRITGSSYPKFDFLGDPSTPAFSSDAHARVYLRLPRGNTQQSPDDGIQPSNFGSGIGPGVFLMDTSGNNILYHSTSFEPVNTTGAFGNFRQAGVAPTPTYPSLLSASKDIEERFLDETYRWTHVLGLGGSLDSLYGGEPAESAIDGPGIGAWVPRPIDVPIQIGNTQATSVWQPVSVIENDVHLFPLSNGSGYAGNSLQVTGFPDRNPKLRHGQTVPFPSAGVLLYPSKNYSAGYSPVGPDYSSLTGTRTFIRSFDASFGGSVNAAGQPFLTLRIDGIHLIDFSYHSPGPGALHGDEGIAISIKVPGLTNWMDLGRPDGSGPSKQDALRDGAGCMVLGPDTFDSVDPQTEHVYCQVRVHVGPSANLFANTGVGNVNGIPSTDVGKVPVMVKVQMGPASIGYSLEEAYVGYPAPLFSGAASPEESSGDVRGVFGIKLV